YHWSRQPFQLKCGQWNCFHLRNWRENSDLAFHEPRHYQPGNRRNARFFHHGDGCDTLHSEQQPPAKRNVATNSNDAFIDSANDKHSAQ
ncbi:MAG: hypothetical protein ACRD4F_15990, partial [Candidatus Angelobacter sp.]